MNLSIVVQIILLSWLAAVDDEVSGLKASSKVSSLPETSGKAMPSNERKARGAKEGMTSHVSLEPSFSLFKSLDPTESSSLPTTSTTSSRTRRAPCSHGKLSSNVYIESSQDSKLKNSKKRGGTTMSRRTSLCDHPWAVIQTSIPIWTAPTAASAVPTATRNGDTSSIPGSSYYNNSTRNSSKAEEACVVDEDAAERYFITTNTTASLLLAAVSDTEGDSSSIHGAARVTLQVTALAMAMILM